MPLFNLIIENIPFLEPVEVFSLFEQDKYSFFLDSGMTVPGSGRYSFIGFWPFLTFMSKGTRIELKGVINQKIAGCPFEVLRNLTAQYQLKTVPDLPPFLGGAVGYFSYEMRHLIEHLPARAIDDLNIPDCIFCFYDLLVVFDHLKQKAYLCSSGFPELSGSRQARASERIREAKNRLASYSQRVSNRGNEPGRTKHLRLPPHLNKGKGERVTLTYPGGYSQENSQLVIASNFTQAEYLAAIGKAQEYIAAGDIYQVNLSQRLSAELTILPFELYKRLRRLNPAPFAGFLNLDSIIIASVSPERFLHLKGRNVETRPIKGTRPRGKTKADDLRLKNELSSSQKDRAELVMIVDLLRNDLGRVCEYGSVRVKELRRLEAHPTVFHTVAIICGQLKAECDRFDLLKACFPGGSITGAPKIRAMQIIDQLEPTKRHIYTGSLGYLSFDGSMDLNIAIRTFLIKGKQTYFQIGGGIVADSIPQEEYRETLFKGQALIEALNE